MLRMTLLALGVLAFLLALVPNLLWLICWLIGLCFGYHMPYALFGWTALALVCLFALVMLYGIFVGRFRMEVNRQEFRSSDLPEALDDYKIVHISDLHLSTFDDRPAALQRVVDAINQEEPDMICFTGDLVSLGVDEVRPYADILRGLKAKDGVCSVLGNHDFLIYRRDLTEEARQTEVERLAAFERDSLGWHLLRNESYTISREKNNPQFPSSPTGAKSQLTVLGVDNIAGSGQGFHTIQAGDLQKAMVGTDGFRILLSHDPSHWRAEVAGKQPIALTLSGHTHAGQVRLFGWPLSAVSFNDNEGWYQEGDQQLYINRGIGCTLPMRLNCPQEITIIKLRKCPEL